MRYPFIIMGFIFIILGGWCGIGFVGSTQASDSRLSSTLSTKDSSSSPKIKMSRDMYYKTKGVVSGSRAPRLKGSDYPNIIGESRIVVWIVAQQHLYWAGFVVGGLFLVMVLEIIGLFRGTLVGDRYDALAHEILRLIILALALAALLGGLLFMSLMVLYPVFTQYLVSIFRSVFLLYGGLVLVFTLLVYLYYYTWAGMHVGNVKWGHVSLGVLVNVVGVLLTFLGNAWSSFMMSPAGVDERGQFLGNVWHTIHTALWNPLNVHRVASHIMLAAGVVAAYGAYRVLTANTQEERARYDWMAYIALVFVIFAFFTMPFGGYWLSREIYAYRQQMGITLFGGLLAWLGVILVTLMGIFFFGLNYYLWQRIYAAGGTTHYGKYSKYIFGIITISMMVYVTPHTVVMTPLELQQMGGQQHPVLSNYGVESAKMSAVYMMTIATLWTLVMWWQCRVPERERHSQKLQYLLVAGFLGGAVNILAMSIYGYYVPANVRIGMQVPIVGTVVVLIFLSLVVAFRASRHSQDSLHLWGLLPPRGYVTLIGLGFLLTWFIGLGGYRRSSVRLYWHINEIMRDASPWAYTHSIGFAANVISLNAIIFWAGLLLMFWLVGSARGTHGRHGFN